MKTLTLCMVSALALTAVTSTHAAEASKAVVTRDFTDIVAPAHQQAYETGIKAFNQCLHQHGVKYTWTAWVHETGDTYKYSYTAGPYTWADMDTMRNQSKACDATWRAQGNPHLQGESSVFLVEMPELSHVPAGWDKLPQPAIVHVLYFTLKPGHDANETFMADMKKFAAAASKTKWPYYYRTLQAQGGDDGSPDYLLVIPNKSWAEAGAGPDPAFWKMVENAYGKADTDALRKSFNDSVAKISDHFDSYNADLSYIAGK